MKKLTSILFLSLFTFGVYANSNNEENNLISQALNTTEPSAGNVSDSDTSEAVKVDKNQEITQVKKDTEVDSSMYSVNKFNFLFYLMYKHKYKEDKKVSTEENQIKTQE
ncbi:MAG: hypothetical protein JXQ96_23420 [Cyclobacteriaceae bacterium]